MKNTLRKIFAPVLKHFEGNDDEQYIYKSSHRSILKVLGLLMLLLSFASLYFSLITSQMGGIFPFFIFFVVGATCEIVGFLGSDRAVAKIWKNK